LARGCDNHPVIPGERQTSVRATLLVGVGAAAVPAIVVVLLLGRYGWHRDELYFLAACHHLARGYVDYPPLIALIGRAVLSCSARPWTRFARR
jgi:hypothetical protein